MTHSYPPGGAQGAPGSSATLPRGGPLLRAYSPAVAPPLPADRIKTLPQTGECHNVIGPVSSGLSYDFWHTGHKSGFYDFYRCIVHFKIYIGHSPTNALFINSVKIIKFTLKYTIMSPLHVPVFIDHHQGALSVPNWSYIYVKTLYVPPDSVSLHCTQHTCHSTTCCHIT